MKRFWSITLSVMLLCAFASMAFAAYPAKPIRMTVGYSAGGGTDIMARNIAQFMADELDEKVLVVNKPGASGQIGTAEVAASRPDGYNTMMLSSSDFLVAPLLNKDPGFSLDDFKYVASFNDSANCLILKTGSPFKDLKEALAYAKANPGKFTVSTSGDAHRIVAAMIEGAADVQFSVVSYNGAGENLNAIMGGHVEAAIIDKRFVKQAEQAGCKAVALAGKERYASILPDLPTFAELGYPTVLDNQRRILAVPAKTSDKVVAALVEAAKSFTAKPEFKEKMDGLSEIMLFEYGDDLNNFMKTQNKVLEDIINKNRDKFPLN